MRCRGPAPVRVLLVLVAVMIVMYLVLAHFKVGLIKDTTHLAGQTIHKVPTVSSTSQTDKAWSLKQKASFQAKPTDSAGCSEEAQKAARPGIKLNCAWGVPMEEGYSLEQKREHYYKVLGRTTASCEKSELLGKAGDGGWFACNHEPFLFHRPCLVYSFGIRDDWSFDDAISKKYGCEVHSFDPSINKEDHKHSDLVYFHNLGLDGENRILTDKTPAWKMSTLCTIMKDLGHLGKTIDYLKFDIEFSEWNAIQAMLDEGCLKYVKQLSFEAHSWGENTYMMFWNALHGLENYGFEKWRVFNRNWRCFQPKSPPNSKRRCPQADMNYINTHYMFKSSEGMNATKTV